MTISKLINHKYAQAQIIHLDDGTTVLQSYNTYVIEVSPKGWLRCYGIYSRTTIKHIGWFMHQLHRLSYYDAKKCWLECKEYNIYTGEFRELA